MYVLKYCHACNDVHTIDVDPTSRKYKNWTLLLLMCAAQGYNVSVNYNF